MRLLVTRDRVRSLGRGLAEEACSALVPTEGGEPPRVVGHHLPSVTRLTLILCASGMPEASVVEFAVRETLLLGGLPPPYKVWAECWVSGTDRSRESAWKAFHECVVRLSGPGRLRDASVAGWVAVAAYGVDVSPVKAARDVVLAVDLVGKLLGDELGQVARLLEFCEEVERRC